MTAPDRKPLPFAEFVALMALLIALVAMSIDMILPALEDIGRDLGVARGNATQLVVSVLFIGMALGQLVYGPLSDHTGRKPAVYMGLGLFMLGSLLSLAAWSFPVMLAGRVLQGAGAAGPRTVTLALVRDNYKGREMARVMSFVMAVFILVPVVAPSAGQGILILASWRLIFGAYLGMALVASIWFGIRQPETLAADRRIPFSFARLAAALGEILRNRIAFGYTLAAGLVFGAFLGYLNSAQQIFQEQYGLGQLFPIYFAVVALALGAASVTNSKLVMRHGMRRLVVSSLVAVAALSAAFWLFAYYRSGHPPLWALMAYLLACFFSVGILFGNLNARAMEPLGHIAGTGAAVVGSLQTLISLLLGVLIGQSYNGTILPLIGGFAILSLAALGVVGLAERGRRLEAGFEIETPDEGIGDRVSAGPGGGPAPDGRSR